MPPKHVHKRVREEQNTNIGNSKSKKKEKHQHDHDGNGHANSDRPWFTNNVILAVAHFYLFNDAFDAHLDLAELARHMWGCELTTADSIAGESAALRRLLGGAAGSEMGGGGRQQQGSGGDVLMIGGRNVTSSVSSSSNSVAGSVLAGGKDLDGSSGSTSGSVMRIRFPRTVAFRERVVEDADDDEQLSSASSSSSSDNDKESGDDENDGITVPLFDADELPPQFSILGNVAHTANSGGGGAALISNSILLPSGGIGGGGYAEDAFAAPSTTPVFASTSFFDAGTTGFAGGGGRQKGNNASQVGGGGTSQKNTVAAFNMSSNVMPSFAFGGGGGGVGDNSMLPPSMTHSNNASSTTGGGGFSSALFSDNTSSLLFGGGGDQSQQRPSGGARRQQQQHVSTGLSEVYQSIVPAGGGGGNEPTKTTNAEATVEELMMLGGRGGGAAPQQQQGALFPQPSLNKPTLASGGGISGAPSNSNNEGDNGAGGGSLFDMAARFATAKVDLNSADKQANANTMMDLFTAADLNAAQTHAGEDRTAGAATASVVAAQQQQQRSKRVTVERITLDSIFCIVSRKGGVSVFGPVPPEELFAACQMVHEYLARAVLTQCPWAVSLSATGGGGSALQPSSAALPPVSPMEMITCGSAAAWLAHSRSLLEDEVARRRQRRAEEKRAADAAKALQQQKSDAMTDAIEDDEDGFALPFAMPAPKKKAAPTMLPPTTKPQHSLTLNPLLMANLGAADALAPLSATPSAAGGKADVLDLRLRRLRLLMSVGGEGDEQSENDGGIKIPGLLDAPQPFSATCSASSLAAWAKRVAPVPVLLSAHSLRVSNMMSYLVWERRAAAALTAHRNEALGIAPSANRRHQNIPAPPSRPSHLLVAEFEAFAANVRRWPAMRLKSSHKNLQSASAAVSASSTPSSDKPQRKHASSATFTKLGSISSGVMSLKPTGGDDYGGSSDSWLPKGVVVMLAATADYARFEWHFEGRVTEVVAQRRSAQFRIVVAKSADDCLYVSQTMIPVCLEL